MDFFTGLRNQIIEATLIAPIISVVSNTNNSILPCPII